MRRRIFRKKGGLHPKSRKSHGGVHRMPAAIRWMLFMAGGILFFLLVFLIASALIHRHTPKTAVSTGSGTLPILALPVTDDVSSSLLPYRSLPAEGTDRWPVIPVEGSADMQGILTAPGMLAQEEKGVFYLTDDTGQQTGEKKSCYIQPDPKDPQKALVTIPSGQQTAALNQGEEALLHVELTWEGRPLYYVARLHKTERAALSKALQTARDIQGMIFEGGRQEELASYMESDPAGAPLALDHVDIHSSMQAITWGGLTLSPPRAEDVGWQVTQTNDVYTDLTALYRLDANDKDTPCSFWVREYFRIRRGQDSLYLANYDRQAQQMITSGGFEKDDKGLCVGPGSGSGRWIADEKGQFVSVSAAGQVWQYDSRENTAVLIYGKERGQDPFSRMAADDRMILLAQTTEGDLTFARLGYEDRGIFEGRTGIAVMEYRAKENEVIQRVFLPIDTSPATVGLLSQLKVFADPVQSYVYVLAGGNLYRLDPQEQEPAEAVQTLVTGLASWQYAISTDGSRMAYIDQEGALHICRLSDESESVIRPGAGDHFWPVGFLGKDLAAGIYREKEDRLSRIDIYGEDGSLIQTYRQENRLISGAKAGNGMLTLELVDEATGDPAGEDYVSGTKKQEDTGIREEQSIYDRRGQVLRLMFTGEEKEKDSQTLHVREAAQLSIQTEGLSLAEEMKKAVGQDLAGRFFVYSCGSQTGIYDRAADALKTAASSGALVTMTDGRLLWEGGNRDLVYTVSTEEQKRWMDTAESSKKAGQWEALLTDKGLEKIDLTGADVESLLYMVNRNHPVIGIRSDGGAVLLTGYTRSDVIYLDSTTGEEKRTSISDMDAMIKGDWRVYR